MTPIEFNCLYWNDGQAQLNDLGVRPSIEDCEERPIIFFQINHIKPYFEDEHSFTSIHSGNEEYIVKLDYKTVKEPMFIFIIPCSKFNFSHFLLNLYLQ